MEKKNQNFNPNVLIVEHFDEKINQIDIQTETILAVQETATSAKKNNSHENETKRTKINEVRAKQIEKLKELKEINLSHLPQKIDQEKFKQKWSHVIDDASFDYKKKIDRIKEELILFDCALLENAKVLNGFYLWIIECFLNERDLDFLK